jgi:NAD(P)-dependent dehydrogenase (short-subunit alcohol dehydrogenase family)
VTLCRAKGSSVGGHTLRLDNKVAVITGAGSGMGRAAALLFAQRGASVVIGEVNSEAGERVASEVNQAGGRGLAVSCDVSSADQVKGMVEAAVNQFGRLDILYNNAGFWYVAANEYVPGVTDAPSPLLEENIFERTIAVNLKGTYLCCKYAIPAMRESGGGSIINVSSVAAIRVGRGASDAYTASKGGVMTITRTLAVEHASYGIRCNCIFPGPVATPLVGEMTEEQIDWARENIPLGRWGQPEEVAKMALFLASDDSAFVTGGMFAVDGGYTAL